MRYLLAILVLFSAAAAQAAPRIIAVGPTGDAPEAQQLRSKLPGLLVGGCGFSMARLDAPCTDMRCAADAVLNAKADMVLETQLTPEVSGPPSVTLTLSTGQRLDVTGSAKTTTALIGDGLARVCQQAASRMGERSLEATPGTPLTSSEIDAALKTNEFELYQCAERAWTGAEKKAERGEAILLDWVVRADGSATAGVVTSPAQSSYSTASDCFARIIGHWKFPPRKRAEVQRGYRLVLDPANAPAPAAPTTLPATLGKEDIAKGLKANVEKLGPCVTTAKNNKEIKPAKHTFVLNWYVLPNGNTTSPKVVGPPEIMRTTLRACFEKVMLGWTFRPTKEGTQITNFPLPITVR
jgi:hypothetical protein